MSDSDQLLRQLESQTLQLTEEESEEMLREAYRVNRKLKEILQLRQESMKPTTTCANDDTAMSNGAGWSESAKLPPISKSEVGFTGVYHKQQGDQHPGRKPLSRLGKIKSTHAME